MPTWAKVIFGVVVFIAASVLAVYLAGVFLLIGNKSNPMDATLLTYYQHWYYYSGVDIYTKRLKVSAVLAAAVGYGLPLALLIAAMKNKGRELHGSARWATPKEVQKAGLYADKGIILGKLDGRYLCFDGMQFVILSAPTRSGKGVGSVIPNLLAWDESVVNLDVKLENFLITSGFRAKCGQQVFLFNPFSIAGDEKTNPLYGRTHRYNPLGYISDDHRLRVTDILAIGYSLYPGDGKDAFFDEAARNLFLGLTLYLCETPGLPTTMGELLRQSSGKGRPVKAYIEGLVRERNNRELATIEAGIPDGAFHILDQVAKARGISLTSGEPLFSDIPKAQVSDVEKILEKAGIEYETTVEWVPLAQWDGVGDPPLSRECADALARFTATSDNTLSSIMATFNVPLTLWASPIVDAATSANDFDLRDIRKRKMSIYLGVPANKLGEAKVLLNMFYTQLVNLNTDQLLHATPALKYSVLMLNDEFTAPGRIRAIELANSYMAGYGLRLLTIIQSKGQLEQEPPRGYGKEAARTLVTNHAVQVFYTPREESDAKAYSEALGYTTVYSKSRSVGRSGGSTSEATGEGAGQKRALMLPQELKEMPQDREVLTIENCKPVLCEKIMYHSDHVFMDRLKSVSPTLAEYGKEFPPRAVFERAWGSGECAVSVPALDLDLHEAVVEVRMRDLTLADIEQGQGLNLDQLALDISKLEIPEGDATPEDVESIVSSFFAALGEDPNYGLAPPDDEAAEDGTSAPPSADELAALDAAAAEDEEDLSAGGNYIELNLDDPAENIAVADDWDWEAPLSDDGNDIALDDEAMASVLSDNNDTYIPMAFDEASGMEFETLDLSVLDMPSAHPENDIQAFNVNPANS